MKLSDFDFDLPDELIATRPACPRTSARLLLARGRELSDLHVHDLPGLLRPGDRLVLNNTKVIPARLSGCRIRDGAGGQTEARIEVTLLDPTTNGDWRALIKPLKKLKIGERVHFTSVFWAECIDKADGQAVLRFSLQGEAFDQALMECGAMPLPPYIAAKRAADERDKSDYQTVFARHSGAVAAPTASLHFDQDLLNLISQRDVEFSEVTLHVGAGTFLPVKVDDPREHQMHAEWGEISAEVADEINRTKKNGGRIIPVGTTALRLIESAARPDGNLTPWIGDTDIFIMPGYQFRIADGLMTNFHLPKSTLMMLVSALMGVDEIKQIYRHAVGNEYRFFSYGDSSLLFPD